MEKFKKWTLSIIIPVYNEKNSIKKIIEKVMQANIGDFKKEIIIVDDCSTDGSKDIIKKLNGNFVTIFFEKNRGKGAALKAGINAATGSLVPGSG
ncbi:MAG: glycosyltransferase family 2 protein [archaeon]